MQIADLHIHSRYAYATSRDSVPEAIAAAAKRKGIGIVGTGDFTHPQWRETLRESLMPAEEGLYVAKSHSGLTPRFVVSGEVSCIYRQAGRVRKIHLLVLLPSLDSADKLCKRLGAMGNLNGDGRPILGISARDLTEIVLDSCETAIVIPAHIWTPHFSLLGAKSGFDSVEECFLDMTKHIRTLETGLSADPAMIRRLSMLDGFRLVSNSDAHSPGNLGRECNILHIERSYPGLYRALQAPDNPGLVGTIEFFPEEGKYFYDGHRNCGVMLSPEETRALQGRCPVCNRPVTTGVLNRIESLSDRPAGAVPADSPTFERLVPLREVIGACVGVLGTGKRVERVYERLLNDLGPELYILREAALSDIAWAAGPVLEEAVNRLRRGRIEITPGFDGEYGKIGLFTADEIRVNRQKWNDVFRDKNK